MTDEIHISIAEQGQNSLTDADKASFRKLLKDYVVSVNELDLELAEKIWNRNGCLSFIHPRGHELGWDAIKKMFYMETMGMLSERSLVPKDVVVNPLTQNTVWAEFYWDFDATFLDGSPLVTEGRETQIWLKTEGSWKIAHVHYSGPATTEEGEGF